jgi:hypothetical protein
MKFISTIAQQRVVLQPIRKKVIETADLGTITEVIPGVKVQFNPMADGGFPTSLLPTRHGLGRARGILDTETAAMEAGVDEQRIIEGLMKHKDYGTAFIGIGMDGDRVNDEERYYKRNEDGSVYCKLCDKAVANTQALNGHSRSLEHINLLQQAQKKSYESVKSVG